MLPGREGICRITATTYDIAGNSVTRTAVDPDHDGDTADNQVTVYTYADPYNHSLATRIKYPDSVNAEWDAVTLAYNLDGTLATRTSQKADAGEITGTVTNGIKISILCGLLGVAFACGGSVSNRV